MGHRSTDGIDDGSDGIERAVADADEIASQRFSVVLRGYDRGEVGRYLQRVAQSHRLLHDQLAAARAELDAIRRSTSVVGVSTAGDTEIDITDAAVGDRSRHATSPGEDDEVFDQMVRDALERAMRTDSSDGG